MASQLGPRKGKPWTTKRSVNKAWQVSSGEPRSHCRHLPYGTSPWSGPKRRRSWKSKEVLPIYGFAGVYAEARSWAYLDRRTVDSPVGFDPRDLVKGDQWRALQNVRTGLGGLRFRMTREEEHARHFNRKVDAQGWLDQVTASVVTGQYVDPRGGENHSREVRHELAGFAARSRGHYPDYRQCATAPSTSLLGNRPIASVRPSDVQSLVKGLSATLAPGSVRNIYDVLAHMYSAAVMITLWQFRHVRRISLPRIDDSEVEPPTVEEVARVVDAMPDRFRAATILLAGSGLRIGELLGLYVAGVDFLRRTVRVERQRLQTGQIGPVKTPKSRRTIPVGQVVLDALAVHLATYPSDLALFTTKDGGPVDYPSLAG